MRTITAKFPSNCHECGRAIAKGETIRYDPDSRWAYHPECVEEDEEEPPAPGSHALADRLGFEPAAKPKGLF
jgi:hypothetical protein